MNAKMMVIALLIHHARIVLLAANLVRVITDIPAFPLIVKVLVGNYCKFT